MEKLLEYAFAVSLFIVFGSIAALAILFYIRFLGPEAKMLRGRLKQIESLRKADGLQADPAASRREKTGAWN